VIGSNSWHTPDLLERADRHAEGAVFVDGFFPESTDPLIKPVIDAYRSAYQEEPISSRPGLRRGGHGPLVREAAEGHAPGGPGRPRRPQGLSRHLGRHHFPGTGEALKNLFLIKVQDGKFVSAADPK